MFKSETLVPEYKNLIGWKQHHDITEIELPVSLTNSVTGEYFQQKHAALRLDYIQSCLPSNMSIEQYLNDVTTDSINEVFNDVLQYRQVNNYGKTLLSQSTLLNRFGWAQDLIINQSRFVGFQIRIKAFTGLKMLINQIGLQFSGSDSFKLYLFHTSKTQPLTEIDVVTTSGSGWDWSLQNLELSAFNSSEYHGGAFILGYYQDNIAVSAINYTNFNWDRGECGSCNNSYSNIWKSIRKHYHIHPIYVANGNFVEGEMFDLSKAIYVNNESWGLNLKMSVACDLTDFFIQNKFVFKNLLAYKVVTKVLNTMKFSQQTNYIEENIKIMILRDLEGDIDTKQTNIPTLYNQELKAVSYNMSGINTKCIPCNEVNKGVSYGVV